MQHHLSDILLYILRRVTLKVRGVVNKFWA